MNILLLTTHLNMGGITRYLLILSKGLLSRQHHVHLISSGGDMEEEFKQLGVHTLIMDIKTKSELSPKVYKALKPIKEYIQRHDIDLIHAQTRVTQVIGHLLHQNLKIPYVSTCHGYFKTRLSRRLFPCWGRVIAISSAVYDHLANDFHLDDKTIHLVRHGIELDQFPQATLDDRQALRRKINVTDTFLIGMIARLSDVKGQDILIRAMPDILKAHKNVKLFLFGEGKMEGELHRLVKKLNLTQHVCFYPHVDSTYKSLILFDICVVPSRQEGLGLSVMEAQASALAVVASRVGGIVSLIEEDVTGLLVDPENPHCLAKKINALLKDEHKRNELGLAARRYALANYDAKTMIDKTIKVYQHAIQESY